MNASSMLNNSRLSLTWRGCIVSTLLLFAAGEPVALAEDACSEKGRTFFVDSEAGQDDFAGDSEQQPWRSLERVNTADLQPGDTLRFKCGGVWRGSLKPQSGNKGAALTYTSYGKGPKPLLLGSLSRESSEDWVQIKENLWATLPLEYRQGAQALDLQQSQWRRHQEAGAQVTVAEEETDAGRIIRFACENSGSASNHVQVWGPELPLDQGAWLTLSFRARSTKAFRLQRIGAIKDAPPWSGCATASPSDLEIGTKWEDYELLFTRVNSSEPGRIHLNLGAALPPGAVFEFQPLSLDMSTPNVSDPMYVDVGNIIFDHGKQCGWKKWSVDTLEKPYDYYYDGASQRVYLYSTANPASLHQSIECALKRHIVSQSGVRHVIYDGLALKYGAAHGFGGVNTHGLIIRNCDLAYIGGGHQLTRPGGHPVRYGNAIEFWAGASNHLIEGCRIWEVYDAALTNQSRGANVRQENITYRNNLIWNCEYSFEYWSSPESAVTSNIRFINNTCVNAGKVWSHAQRPDQNGSHLMFYGNSAQLSDFEVKYNIFYQVSHWGSRYTSGWEILPEMNHNVWFSDTGIMAYWFKEKIASFADYKKATGLDKGSIFADPKFIDPEAGDYRLSPESPARSLRADGAPVGVASFF